MQDFRVQLYTKEYQNKWNSFLNKSKNASFLFHRDYMEYHNSRFEDFSLMVFKKQLLVAVLPANRVDSTLISHAGLSYGGVVLHTKNSFEDTFLCFKAIIEFLKQNSISKLLLKLMPRIYNKHSTDEVDYIIFILKARLVRRDLNTVLKFSSGLSGYNNNRKRNFKRAMSLGVTVKESQVFDDFWNDILIPNLNEKYQLKPVHTLEEITFLKNKFPNNIKQFNAYFNDIIIGGITIFETEQVVHAQYISTLSRYKDYCGLDAIIYHLISSVYSHKEFLSFGISTENNGHDMNESLLSWKESFGGKAMIHDFYEIDIK